MTNWFGSLVSTGIFTVGSINIWPRKSPPRTISVQANLEGNSPPRITFFAWEAGCECI